MFSTSMIHLFSFALWASLILKWLPTLSFVDRPLPLKGAHGNHQQLSFQMISEKDTKRGAYPAWK